MTRNLYGAVRQAGRQSHACNACAVYNTNEIADSNATAKSVQKGNK